MEKRVTFPRESQLRQSRAIEVTVNAAFFLLFFFFWSVFCLFVFVSIVHKNSDIDYRIFNVLSDVNACDFRQGMYGHLERVCTDSCLWKKNPSPHRGIESASAACRSDALPTELPPYPICTQAGIEYKIGNVMNIITVRPTRYND